MNKNDRPTLWTIFMTNNWNTLLTTLSIFVAFLTAFMGYLLLGDNVQNLLPAQKPSAQILAARQQRAADRLAAAEVEASWDRVVEGIHQRTGFYADPNLPIIIAACTSCHSSKLVTQNRATRPGWEAMIRWMQETQGLPDLGDKEPIILDYLAKYYAPKSTGRRAHLDLTSIEWYILELD